MVNNKSDSSNEINLKHSKNQENYFSLLLDSDEVSGLYPSDPNPTNILINEKTVFAVNQSMNVIHTDIEGYILYGNQNIFDLTLYEPEELIGKHTRIFNAGYHPKEFFKDMWDTILSGKIWRGDVKNRRKDGRIIWVRMIITPLLDETGSPYQFVALKEDITEKKEIEFQLAQKDKQLSALTNNSYDVVGIIDKNGEIIYLNPAFERVLGFGSADTIGLNLLSFLKEDAQFGKGILQNVIDNPNCPIREQARFKNKDGTIRWCDVVLSNYLEDPHINGIVFNLRDFTKQKEATDIIKYFANHDYLTGLPNRRHFESHLNNILATSKSKNQIFAVLSFDLDGFKKINDTYGHEIGDQLLKRVGQRIGCIFEEKGFIGRLGGDEFAVILPNIKDSKFLFGLADSLIHEINRPFHVENYEITISASVGISMYPKDGKTIKTLLKNADIAMYQAKREGKNHYQLYSLMVD
jgi:diguanylate cyclase (GGDEF)-like protein/PAS domain S-box-containing protein